jgi:hypothetical protein
VFEHLSDLITSNYTELQMTLNIIDELRPTSAHIEAIRAMAACALDQAFPDQSPPDWAVTIELLARHADAALHALHDRLTLEVAKCAQP